MERDDQDVQTTDRRRRRRRPEARAHDDGNGTTSTDGTTGTNGTNPGLLRVLWADLRKQTLPRPLEPEEMALMEAEEEMRQHFEEEAARAHSISPDHMETLRRRYSQSAN